LIVCRGHVVETLARATDVVLDKTGTLTLGRLQLARTELLADMDAAGCLRVAAALEQGSTHPIAQALLAAGPHAPAANAARHYAGLGVEGTVDGRLFRLGRAEFVMSMQKDPAPWHSPVLPADDSIAMLGDESRCLALFVLGDALRPDAREFIDAMRQSGKRVHLISGDRAVTVERVASGLGIGAAVANASPQDKLDYVQALQRAGKVVAMIGDGLNDAPVLAQAGVSIAMGDGAWMSQRQADAVLVSGRLCDLRAAFATSTQALAVIRENLFWAVGYNLTAVPLAALGMVTPWMAGIGMSASSLLVILNSLRLSRHVGAGEPAARRKPAAAA
jgi:Cu2+-exporting ATPase